MMSQENTEVILLKGGIISNSCYCDASWKVRANSVSPGWIDTR